MEEPAEQDLCINYRSLCNVGRLLHDLDLAKLKNKAKQCKYALETGK